MAKLFCKTCNKWYYRKDGSDSDCRFCDGLLVLYRDKFETRANAIAKAQLRTYEKQSVKVDRSNIPLLRSKHYLNYSTGSAK